MSTAEERIERGLKLYLREEHGLMVTEAKLGMTEFEASQWEGCDTCGYGGDEDRAFTPLLYKLKGDGGWVVIELDTVNSVNLLPTLLPYIERAN